MKNKYKYIFVLISLLIIKMIFLTSCEKDKTEKADDEITIPLSTDGEYNETTEKCQRPATSNFIPIGNSIIYRQQTEMLLLGANRQTGAVNSMCKDPLCNHSNESCFFTRNYQSITPFKNRIYCIEPGRGSNKILSFNEFGEDIIVHYTNDGNAIGRIIISDDYIFFNQIDGEDLINIYRINLKTKQTDCLTPGNKETLYYPLFLIGDNFYFYENDYFYIYKSDIDMKTKVLISEDPNIGLYSTDGNYIYYIKESSIKDNKNGFFQDLMRFDLNGENEILIQENATYYWLTDQHIYFSYLNNDPESKQTGKPEDRIKGKIYVMNKDGSDIKLIRDDPGLFIAYIYEVYDNYIYYWTVDIENPNSYGTYSTYKSPFRSKIGDFTPPQELIYN